MVIGTAILRNRLVKSLFALVTVRFGDFDRSVRVVQIIVIAISIVRGIVVDLSSTASFGNDGL